MELGWTPLSGVLNSLVAIVDNNRAPQDPAVAPTFRIYSAGQLMPNGTGALTQVDTGTVTAASNASPIVITSANHGLTTGTRVTVSGVGGNTAANGTFTVTNTGTNTFSLNSSTGNSNYTSGGTWHTTGAYAFNYTVSANNGFQQGQVYTALVNYTIGSTPYAVALTFGVY